MRFTRFVRPSIAGAALLALTTGPAGPVGATGTAADAGPPLAPAASTSTSAHRTTYRTIDLGTLGGAESTTRAINDSGQVAGFSDTAGGYSHAFVWRRGTMTDLGVLGGGEGGSGATAINARGDVVGWSATPSGSPHAFLWRRGRMIDLGTLGGAASAAYGINDRGQVVGVATTRTDGWHAFRWDRGRMTDLGDFDAFDINDRGQVAGTDEHATMAGTAGQAVVWWHGRLTRLGPGTSRATSINDHGRMLVQTDNAESRLWRNGVLIDFGTLGGPGTGASGLNDRDQVVGVSDVAGAPTQAQHPFLWEHGRMTDLTARGVDEDAAVTAINDRGRIAGEISGAQGRHAALFCP